MIHLYGSDTCAECERVQKLLEGVGFHVIKEDLETYMDVMRDLDMQVQLEMQDRMLPILKLGDDFIDPKDLAELLEERTVDKDDGTE